MPPPCAAEDTPVSGGDRWLTQWISLSEDVDTHGGSWLVPVSFPLPACPVLLFTPPPQSLPAPAITLLVLEAPGRLLSPDYHH